MRQRLPVFPGSLTVVASKARTGKVPAQDSATPRLWNSETHIKRSHSLAFRRRFMSATSERSANPAFLARKAVSLNEYPQPQWMSKVRSRSSGDLFLRRPLSAPVSQAISCQSWGKQESNVCQSSSLCSSSNVCGTPTKHIRKDTSRQQSKLALMGINPRLKRFAVD